MGGIGLTNDLHDANVECGIVQQNKIPDIMDRGTFSRLFSGFSNTRTFYAVIGKPPIFDSAIGPNQFYLAYAF